MMPQYLQSGAGTIWGWNTEDSLRSTEGFSSVWAQYVANYANPEEPGQGWMRDPADQTIAARHAAISRDSTLQTEARGYDTSYWYSPVFWLSEERYRGPLLLPLGGSANNAKYLARHRFDTAQFSSLKVMLFERFDSSQRKRPTGVAGGQIEAMPQWNNPAARPQATFVDGSVSEVKMNAVHALGESTLPEINSVFRPSGYYNPSPQYAQKWLEDVDHNGTDPYETGGAPYAGTTGWRAYFYATRNGIRGRDVQKR